MREIMIDDNIKGALKYFFGFDDFLDNQREIVEKILSGNDLGVVMPTGAGKSLCYQLPALMMDNYTIIVSPLISLMKDQVDSLRRRGIAAGCINSAVNFSEQQEVMRDVQNGMTKLLYVAPERFSTQSFRSFVAACPPAMLVVDEAHCISQWGHDFRPSYTRIGEFAENFRVRQICAFTATATRQVREDIRLQLHRPDMEMMVAGFKRPNLSFSVQQCSGNDSKLRAIASLLEKPCSTIIYASTRKAVEELADNFKCIAYHAGMGDNERALAQERFMTEDCPVLAATNAFGMGIDRPDVRRVIHYNIPGTLEAYYQEAGRAGRDGEPAECILLFSYSDRYVHEFLIEMSNPPPEAVEDTWRVLRRLNHGEKLELSGAEIAELAPAVKNEQSASSVLSILEQHGYIERTYRGQNSGTLRFIQDTAELAQLHQSESTQRSRFISRVIRHAGSSAASPVLYSYEQLSAIAGLTVEQLKRVLNALNGDCIEWKPPFSGRGIILLRPDEKELDIDFSAMEQKHDLEISRLDDMIDYTRSRGCRQKALIGYFGEESGEWICGCCDHCAGDGATGAVRVPMGQEADIVRTVLFAVDHFRGRLGSGKISMILTGARRAELVERRLDRNAFFGKLSGQKQNKLMMLMRSMEEAGLLRKCGSMEYPCVGLTPAGRTAAESGAIPPLAMPELDTPRRAPSAGKTEKKAAVAGLDGSDSEIFVKLRELRMTMAREQHVPAFVIFPDSVLKELAHLRPRTVEEAALVKGVGPVKLASVMPRFLDLLNSL